MKIYIIYLKSKSPFTEFMRNITEYVMKLWHVMKHSFAPNPDLEICPPLRRSQNCRWGRQTQPGKSVAINKEQRANSDPCLIIGTVPSEVDWNKGFRWCSFIKNIYRTFLQKYLRSHATTTDNGNGFRRGVAGGECGGCEDPGRQMTSWWHGGDHRWHAGIRCHAGRCAQTLRSPGSQASHLV